MVSTKKITYIICLASFIFIDFYFYDSSYQQQALNAGNKKNEIQSLQISIDETEDSQTDRKIVITGGSSDESSILDKVLESEEKKLQKILNPN